MVYNRDTMAYDEDPTENIGSVTVSAKFLKNPFNFRYMVASSDIYLTPLSHLCALVWGAIRLEAIKMWEELFPGYPCWLILSADTIRNKVEDLNRVCTQNTVLQCYDVKQYYTNVPLQDLKTRLTDVATRVYRRQTNRLTGGRTWVNNDHQTYIQVHEKSTGRKHSFVRLTPQAAAQKRNSNRNTKTISLQQAIKLATTIIFNTFFWLGNAVLLQTIGIPMGANPSPAFADLYLFSYEFDFVSRMWAHEDDRDILLRWFSVIARFQDDIFAGEAPYFLRAHDRQQFWSTDHPHTSTFDERDFPHRGIYPCQYLTIEREQLSSSKVNHQDVTIFRVVTWSKSNRRTIKFHTKMYSKIDKLKSTGQSFVFYPDVDTFLSPKCTYGIVLSRAYAFARRCSQAESFVEANIRLISHLVMVKHYNLAKCLLRLRRFCIRRPHLYGAKSWRTHYYKASRQLYAMRNNPNAAHGNQ